MKTQIKNLKSNIKYILNNENGAPTLEAIVGFSVALCAGAAIYIIYYSLKYRYKEVGEIFEELEIYDTPEI